MKALLSWLGFVCLSAVAFGQPFSLNVPAFPKGKPIPRIFTADGNNISPALSWSGLPAGTRETALICEDPDAGAAPWIHWVVYNIPLSMHSLPEWVPTRLRLDGPKGALQGKNSFDNVGYGGPEPPPGKWHHYYFRLYALSSHLGLPAGITAAELVKKMRGHVLGRAEWMGVYRR